MCRATSRVNGVVDPPLNQERSIPIITCTQSTPGYTFDVINIDHDTNRRELEQPVHDRFECVIKAGDSWRPGHARNGQSVTRRTKAWLVFRSTFLDLTQILLRKYTCSRNQRGDSRQSYPG